MNRPALETFDMDGIRFVMDTRPGKERGTSTPSEFILVKTRAFLNFYKGLANRNPKSILEIGMFEGGSLVYFDKLYKPEILVGLDLRPEIGALEEYRKGRPHIHTIYRQSQDDPKLASLLAPKFPDGIDLIVDDASHLYAQTRATFLSCFPLLKPGGLYVIEDWSWAHKPAHQTKASSWWDMPAMTNLLFELVVNVPDSTQMNRVTVLRDMILIEKAATAQGAIDLDHGLSRLRGRKLPQI